MRKIFLLFSAMCIMSMANAGDWVKIRKDKTTETQIQLLPSQGNSEIVKFNLNAYQLKRVQTPEGLAYVVNAPESSPMLSKGCPDLPKLTASLIMPLTGSSSMEVLYSDYIELTDIDIAPSKGTIYRDQDPASIAYTYSEVYNENAFFPGNLANVNEPYIIRDLRGQTVSVFPFAYNPVERVLRIYTDVTVRVNYNSNQGINELNTRSNSSSTEYNAIYKRHFLNFTQEKYTPLEEGVPGRILIISYADFMDEMNPFITWKREKGIETEIVDVATIGDASAIKTYIANEYANGLEYVLLVGDAQQVPTTTTGSDSDNEYVYIVGSDHYADCFIGRISAETEADVTNQVAKIVQYERDYLAGNAWLENAFCSASNEGGSGQGDDGESDETHMANIATDLEDWGYDVTHVNQTGGSNSQISSAFNAGIGVGNYVGHGDVTLWVNTTFTNTEVNALTNQDKYPFIFSVACVNGDFRTNTCFAEAWLRATNGVKPTGAVGFLGSTINQSWNEPMDAQDEMNDILVESYSNNIKRTFGGISFNGMFHMLDEYSTTDAPSMADTWTLFGDPSLMVRTKDPVAMTISHNAVLNVGQATFSVNCNVDGALVSLSTVESDETVILGTGVVNGGSVTVDMTALTAPGIMKVTVTAFDKETYQEDVTVIVPDGPYVVLNDVLIDDAAGNNNASLDNGESVLLDVAMENVGVETATAVSATVSSTYADLTISDDAETFGDIAADAIENRDNAYAISIVDGIVDQTIVPLDFAIVDGDGTEWNAVHNLVVNAPELSVDFVSVDDAAGNGNGIMDPGEIVTITFVAGNEGHNEAVEGEMILNITSNGTTTDSDLDIAVNPTEGAVNVSFTVEVSASATAGSNMLMTVNYNAGAYTVSGNFSLPIGLQIEDWESNDLESYEWENDASTPWTIVTENPHAGDYCLKSGALTESGGSSVLIINLNVTTGSDVSFYKKVSCEDDSWGFYDYLVFSVDGSMKGQWAGEVAWSQESYNVTSGEHELKWAYEKDAYMTNGSDCAWIDDIILPSHDQATFIEHTTSEVETFKFEISPNPTADYTFFNFSIEESKDVKIDIVDLNGRVVETIYNQKSPEGVYRIAYDVSSIPNGLYVIRFNAQNTVHTEQLVISK